MSVRWTWGFCTHGWVSAACSGRGLRKRVGGGTAYQGVLPFPQTRPFGVVAPCHALAAGDQVGQPCAEQRQAAEYAQDV
jgi:hypothetical protein